ncbi:hypothetical protein F5144DRAFT_629621 [Chaetomium tenue]|uniref:Uncharacterized protein n=1 Tax=Chaetomium tenue TaxID=1854479 RepID=A0ACB7P5T0_9PEZI|nr:hypothetical protein F5144DRAFT_629621 [Chaetomium globosum]
MDSPPTTTPHRKRKRAPSDAVINPLSHSPDTLRQFALAGYPAEKPLPSKAHPGFPHRSTSRPSRKQTTTTTIDSDTEPDAPTTTTTSPTAALPSTPASDADDDATATEGGGGGSGDWLTTTDGETTDLDSNPSPKSTTRKRRSRKHNNSNKEAGPDRDRTARAYRARVGCLAAVARRCLAEGDVARAKRAFGLLARARVYGKRVDLRRERFWEVGAEVLGREGGERKGEGKGGSGGDGDGGEVMGEGEGGWEGDVDGEGEEEDEEAKAERLARLKAYYEYLIQQYPYSKQHAGSVNSVLDFQVALFSAEMEAAHAAHKRGLEKLQQGGSWDEEDGDMDVDEPIDYGLDGLEEGEPGGEQSEAEHHLQGLSRQELKLREKENGLRLEALRRMTDISQRMDIVMETIPFSRDHELLRLRAMVALYTADLHMRPAPRSPAEDRQDKRARAGQREKAKLLLRQIKATGGGLRDHDERLLETLDSDDEDDTEDEDRSVLPMFSSMHV